MKNLLAAAAYPTVRAAAKAIVQTLTRARDRLRENEGGAPPEYFDVVARDCLAEARRILSVVEEVDEITTT